MNPYVGRPAVDRLVVGHRDAFHPFDDRLDASPRACRPAVDHHAVYPLVSYVSVLLEIGPCVCLSGRESDPATLTTVAAGACVEVGPSRDS